MKRWFLVATLVALALTLSAPTAWADSPNNPKAPIQSGNSFCGADIPTLPVIGFTNYHRNGDTVYVNYHLKDGIPNSVYRVELWGDLCTFFGVVDTVTTNKKGVANANGSVTVPPTSTRFFAAGLGPNFYNDTPAVILLP